MRKIILAGVILVLGLVGNGFSEDGTNRQILEKLDKLEEKINSLDVKVARLETKVDEGQKSLQKQIDNLREETRAGQQSIQKQIDGLDKRIDGLQSQINGLQNMILGVLAGIFALISFVLWDRRTALAPAVKKVEALEKREENLERVLKEFAIKEPRLTEALKSAGIL